MTQLSEVTFYDADDAAIAVSSVANDVQGRNPVTDNEGANKAVDGSTSTKWLDNCCSPAAVLEFTSASAPDAEPKLEFTASSAPAGAAEPKSLL